MNNNANIVKMYITMMDSQISITYYNICFRYRRLVIVSFTTPYPPISYHLMLLI